MLTDGDLLMRPMTEQDLDSVFSWSDDPEALWLAEHRGDRGRDPPNDLCLVDGGDAEWWVPGVGVVLDEEHDRFERLAPGGALVRCRLEAPRHGLAMAITSIGDG